MKDKLQIIEKLAEKRQNRYIAYAIRYDINPLSPRTMGPPQSLLCGERNVRDLYRCGSRSLTWNSLWAVLFYFSET